MAAAVLPTHMRASVLTAPGTLESQVLPMPVLQPDEILVRVLAAGICGSDVAAFRGVHPYKTAPAVLGHELSGTVVARGAAVERFQVEERVCAASFSHCERCTQCLRGAIHLCSEKRALNHRGWHGAFAEYVVLKQNMTYALPVHVPDVLGALVEPLSIGLHAVRLAGPADKRRLAVLGVGNIGLACLLAARRFGFAVASVDVRADAGRLSLSLGAKAFVLGGGQNLDLAVQEALGGRPEVVLLATGYANAIDDALALVQPGGTIVVVSYFDQPQRVGVNELVANEATMVGSALSTDQDMREAIDWLVEGALEPSELIAAQLPLHAAAEAMSLVCDPARPAGKVVLTAKDS